jgi:GNAT superfamily N-acetyltransferase
MSRESLRIEPLADHVERVPTIARWHHAEWNRLNPALTLEAREARIRKRANRGGIPTTLVALVEDELAGSASLVEDDMDTHPELTPWLASVYVPPEFRRRGVASALTRAIEAQAAREGVETLWLWTPDQERLYARLGWTMVAREPYRGVEATIMRKDLKSLGEPFVPLDNIAEVLAFAEGEDYK